MNFQCQADAIENLKILAEHNQHGVLIVGNSGSGKTYLARQYAQMLGISDFYIINPVISDLKSTIEGCTTNSTSVVLCIEDLDNGVVQAAYPLLKLIEDCPSYIYVVVTCNNLYSIPDTIPSRCALVTINPPTQADIKMYAESKDPTAYEFVSKHKVWESIKSMTEADIALKFTPEHIKYYNNITTIIDSKDSVSNLAWKLQHYDDNTETPIVIVLRCLMSELSGYKRVSCIKCLNDLNDNRISKNAIVSKFVFDLKYCE